MNNTITLRTWAKVKEYHFMPCKQPNGTNFPFVKPVRIMPDGSSEMILSEAERNNPESQYFIREDADIVVTDGTTFNLDNPLERNRWLAIKDSDLIVPSRDARDSEGNLLIDGNKTRYGIAELWIDVPGQESEKTVNKKKEITRAWTFIMNDSADGRLTKCKLLGKNLRNAPSPDVEAFLYETAEKNPKQIIDLYTNGDTALRLLFIDARDKNVIKKKDGLFMYGETILGGSEEAVLFFFKLPANQKVVDMIKYEVYPEYIPVSMKITPTVEESVVKPEETTTVEESVVKSEETTTTAPTYDVPEYITPDFQEPIKPKSRNKSK